MKSFRVPRQDRPPIEFEIIYDKLIDGEWEEQTEKFRARGSAPGNMLVSMTASAEEGPGVQAKELQGMFNRVILPDDLPRFNEILDDADTAVPIEVLGQILEWLVEKYAAGRPTQSV